jgi:hypothetical protein
MKEHGDGSMCILRELPNKKYKLMAAGDNAGGSISNDFKTTFFKCHSAASTTSTAVNTQSNAGWFGIWHGPFGAGHVCQLGCLATRVWHVCQLEWLGYLVTRVLFSRSSSWIPAISHYQQQQQRIQRVMFISSSCPTSSRRLSN